MIITILTPGFPPWRVGGEEYYTHYQAHKLMELGHEVQVIAENKLNNQTGIKNIEPNLKIVLIKSVNTNNKLINTLLLFLEYFKAYIKHIKSNRTDIIHGHDTIGPGFAAVVLGKLFRKPVFITWHGAELLENKFSLIGNIGRKIVCKFSDGIIVSSELFRNLAISNVGRKYADKFTIIPPAVDVKEFSPEINGISIKDEYELNDSLIILTVGRLERVKGYDILLKSIPSVVKKFPNVTFMIVGSGSLQEKLINLSYELEISQYVKFLGSIPRETLPKLYSICDIFILPTRGEGFGMVFLEAWSSGKPIITTPHAPIIANIVNQYGGGIVSFNEPSEISSAISILLADKKLRLEMGAKGRETALNFSWKNMVKQNIIFYKNSLLMKKYHSHMPEKKTVKKGV